MKKILVFFILPALFFSCKKDETPANTCTISNTTIAGTYKLTAIKYKASSSAAEQDQFSFLQDCEKDNTYELKADNSVVVGDGAEVCPGPPPPGTVTNWSLSADNKTLTFGVNFTIKSFDCTTLVLTEKDSFTPGDERTSTYVKQ